ncbi:MAG: cupin [Pelagibacteraceae bacterium]|nr:cupin [Pelagibacteraceae bacterium]PPR50650.1 MAG: hypothetical protein CFH20_00894 [Alphaproteobacteria bacterium MarineAlpha5_Bin10]|tara:strand:+ start:105 stop:464 length:360 start_codon:yes stop_codon:yes gene_type:complete
MPKPEIQKSPFIVPTEDKKLIEEHFGRASIGGKELSIAHMIAPAQWTEPYQKPDFDEYTMVVKGILSVEVDGEIFQISKGQSILIKKGSRVRYSNPYEEKSEYWSVCNPAFSIETVNRE